MLLKNVIVQSMCHSVAKGNFVAVMMVRNCLFLNSVLFMFNASASTTRNPQCIEQSLSK